MSTKKYHHGDLKNALIQAGTDILAEQGVGALSLRKVAQKAGVSHAAPYAHFADKQALIAAISTDGFMKLFEQVSEAAQVHVDSPRSQLFDIAWAYVQFAGESPARFKVMFSGLLEKEREYPAYVEMVQKNFRLVISVVSANQAAGILRPAPAELMAVSVWSLVHGFVMLKLEGQISHHIFEEHSLQETLDFILSQVSLK